MPEFTPITTQEQFDSAIKDRLTRDRESTVKKYEGWLSPDDQAKATAELQRQLDDVTKASAAQAKKYANYDKDLADRDTKIKGYETASVKTRVALAAGLPYELSSRLNGDTEEDIQKDADMLVKMVGANHPTTPLANTEKNEDDSKTAALKALSEKLKENCYSISKCFRGRYY